MKFLMKVGRCILVPSLLHRKTLVLLSASMTTTADNSKDDILSIILTEHNDFRQAFKQLDQLRHATSTNSENRLDQQWKELAARLEVHASGEEQIFYPVMLKHVDDGKHETKHALKDHNEIRETTEAVNAEKDLGSAEWWRKYEKARDAAIEHLEEEEEDVFPAFREQIAENRRVELGREFAAYRNNHLSITSSGSASCDLPGAPKDPDRYVQNVEKDTIKNLTGVDEAGMKKK
jgi:iron-sulfur cluster repair protein YtfE (RIC family)